MIVRVFLPKVLDILVYKMCMAFESFVVYVEKKNETVLHYRSMYLKQFYSFVLVAQDIYSHNGLCETGLLCRSFTTRTYTSNH